MKKIFEIISLLLLLAVFSCNEAKRGNDADSKEQAEEANAEKFEDNSQQNDADFVARSVASSYGEIKFAELANQRSGNPEVKEIATMLIKDHTQSLNELKTMAMKKAITVPVEEDDEVKRLTQRIVDEAGKDFDRRWVKEMIDRHEESINAFEERLNKTEDPDLRALVNKTLPTLKAHLEKLNVCYDKIKDDNA